MGLVATGRGLPVASVRAVQRIARVRAASRCAAADGSNIDPRPRGARHSIMYSRRQLVADVRADLRKYVALFRPAPKERPPSTVRVLLSSPGFFVVAAYRGRFWIKSTLEDSRDGPTRWLLKAISLAITR